MDPEGYRWLQTFSELQIFLLNFEIEMSVFQKNFFF